MEELIINNLDDLEELYTMHVITYAQYLNLKKELEEKEQENE